MADYTFTTALDTSGMLRDATVAARNLPALRFRVDSKPLGVISGQISEFQRSLSAASARVLSFSATAGQIFAVTRAFQATFKAMVDVEKQLIDINSILGLSKTQLTQFSTQLFKVANETGQSFKVAAEGAVELSRQGLSASETIKRLKDSLTLTRLSGLKAADSVTAITTALNGFNDAALDSTAIINKLSSVDAAFAVSSNDLAQALSRVGSTAKDTGVSFDELMGLVTAAKQITGREGAVIGNSLKTIFTRIQRPDTLNQLKELGVLVENVGGEALSAQQILVNLAKAYDTLSSAQKNQVVQLSAGVFQANQFRAILQDLSKESSIAARATNISATATDQAARRQAELNKTLASSINETINNLTNAAAKIGKLTLEPALKVVLDGKSVIPGLNTLVQSISGDTEQKGQNVGEFFATGLLKGIGNYLSGPGIALGGVLIARLFATFASFTAKSVAQIIEVTGSRYQAEQAITKLLAEQPSLYSRINALGGNQQKIESLINAELLKRNVLLNEQAAAIQAISGLTSARNIPFVTRARPFAVSDENLVRNPRKGAAVGFVPELKEITGALEGGYKPGKVKEIDIPRIGKVVYNTAETVKKFPGFIQPAIIPPQSSKAGINYNKSFINAHGFSPYKSEGLVPNFLDISLLKQFRKGLQAPIKFGYGLGQISGYSNSSGIILNPDTGLTRETLSHETVHQILPQNLKSALKETSIYNSEYFKGTRAFDKIRYRPKHYDINTVAEEFLADIPSLAQTSPKFVASKLQMMGLNEKQIKTILKLSNRIYEKSGQRLQTNLPAYSSGFSPSYNKGLVPNYANPKDSFLNYIREINPSYVTKFRALQKDDTGLAKFLRLTTDQRGAPAMQQMGDLLKKDLLQYTPRQYGLGTTAYANLKENPQQIRAGIGKVFGQFGMDIPNFMPQINRGQLEILLKDSQFAKKLKSFTYTNAKGETKDYNLAQHRVRPDLNVGAPAPAGYKNWTDLDNQTRSLALYVQSPDGKIGKKRFSLDSFKQLRAEGETFDIAAKGLIPSFNALSSAISREKSAGLPLSQIRVGSSPRIQSHLNPLGLGVYNTRDEPGGLQQGINRVAAMGLDPKKAGIPNYANEGLFTSTLEISKTGQLSLLELKSLNDEINKYKNQIRFGQKDQTKINQAIDSLTKAYQLNEAAIQKITLSFTSLYKPILATQQRIGKAGVNRQGLTGQLSGVSGGQLGFDFLTPPAPGQGEFLSIVNQANLQTRQKAVGQTTTQFQALLLSQLVANNKTRTGYLQSNELDRIRNNIGIGGTSNLSRLGFIPNEELTGVQSLRLQKALVESRKKRREEIERLARIRPDFEEKRRQERIRNGLSIGQSSFNYGQTETGFVGKSELVGVQSSRLQELLAKSKIELPQRQALDSFNKTLGGLGLSSVLFNTKAYRNAIAQSKSVQGEASLKEFRQGIANRALTASFVTPLLAGLLEQGATTTLGTESVGARGISRGIGALGNVGSFALTGLGIAGGNPLGAAVGGGIGFLTELPSVFKAFSDTLPDLERELEKVSSKTEQFKNSLSEYLDVSDKLATGTFRNKEERNRLAQRQAGLFALIESPQRDKIQQLVNQGEIGKAADLSQQVVQKEESKVNRQRIIRDFRKELDLGDKGYFGNIFGGTAERNIGGKFSGLNPFSGDIRNPLSAIANPFAFTGRLSSAIGRGFAGFSPFDTSLGQEVNPDRVGGFVGNVLNNLLLSTNEQNESIADLLKKNPDLFGGLNRSQAYLQPGGISQVFSILKKQGFTGLEDIESEFGKFSGNDLLTAQGRFIDKLLKAADAYSKVETNTNQLTKVTYQTAQQISEIANRILILNKKAELSSTLFDSLNQIKNAGNKGISGEFLRRQGLLTGEGTLSRLTASRELSDLGQQRTEALTSLGLKLRSSTVKTFGDISVQNLFESLKSTKNVSEIRTNAQKAIDFSGILLGKGNLTETDLTDPEKIKGVIGELNKSIDGLIKTVQDETEKKQIEAFRESVERLGKSVVDTQGEIIEINAKTVLQSQTILQQLNQELQGIKVNKAVNFGGGIQNFLGGQANIFSQLNLANRVSQNANPLTAGFGAFRQAEIFKSLNVPINKELREKLGRGLDLTAGKLGLTKEQRELILDNFTRPEKNQEELTATLRNLDNTQKPLQDIMNRLLGAFNSGNPLYVSLSSTAAGTTGVKTSIATGGLGFETTIPTVTELNKKLGVITNDSTTLGNRYQPIGKIAKSIGLEFVKGRDSSNVQPQRIDDPSFFNSIKSKPFSLGEKNEGLFGNIYGNIGTVKPDFLNDIFSRRAESAISITQKQISEARLADNKLDTNKTYIPESTNTTIAILEDKLSTSRGELEEMVKSGAQFSDTIAEARKQADLLAVQLGKFNEVKLGEIFTKGLEYGPKEFQRDLVLGVNEFREDFRGAFKEGFREAITGAKSFTDALRGIGINIASSFLGKASDLAINSLLGKVFSSSTSVLTRNTGGYIPKLAKGGFVNMGSGIKDDVPAFLSGGEFVLNKRAVSRIGKHNLDRINFSQGVKQPERFLRPEENQFSGAVLSDYSSLSGSSAIIKLANTLEVNKFGRDPRMNVSPLLSSYGLTDENNPQNKLRFAREKWIFERKQFDKQVEEARKKFNDQQVTSLVTSYLTAGINAVAMGSGPKGVKGGFDYRGNGSQFAGYAARGGYIPRFNKGGYFGGDMGGDRLAAMVMGGEYIMSPKTVSNYGTPYFNSLNRMANGGYVGGDYSNTDINDNISKLISVTEQVRDRLSSPTNQNNQQNQQGGGNVFNINISTSLNSDGSVKNTQTDVKSNNNQNQNTVNDKDAMVKLSQTIRTKIIEVINQESRGGGILSEKFVSRR